MNTLYLLIFSITLSCIAIIAAIITVGKLGEAKVNIRQTIDKLFENDKGLDEYLRKLAEAAGYQFVHLQAIQRPARIECRKIEKDECADSKVETLQRDLRSTEAANPLSQRGKMSGQSFEGPTEIIRTGDRRDGKDRRVADRRAKPVKKKKKNRKQTKRKRG